MREPAVTSQLYWGDCLKIMDGLITDGVKVDAIITDPPYGTTACMWDSVIPFDEMWKRLKALRYDNTPIVLFGNEPFSSSLRMSNMKDYKYDWIWEKSKATGYLNAKKQPMRAHEDIVVFYKKQCTYNPQMTKGEPYNKGCAVRDTLAYRKQEKAVLVKNDIGLRYPRSVQYFVTAESEGKLHPTQKPLALMEYLVKTYTNEGDTVLDFTMGSGTTGKACKNLNRNFIGIELDLNYYMIAWERINA